MKREALIIFGLIAITLAAFVGVGQCDFVNYDDFTIIVNNPHVIGGFTAENFAWAWKYFDGGPNQPGLYIPLTTLSLMLNATLFGPGPHSFHWVNLLLHTANAILLYLVLRQATGAIWRSALAAAIFAVHPLRVESVAWAVERKDVLSGFFGFLTMLAYMGYARSRKLMCYAATLTLFAAALLAKPAVVTLPFLLLLLDFWPLGRWDRGPAAAGPDNPPRRSLPWLILEKLPLIAIAVAISIVAMSGVSANKATTGDGSIHLAQGLANASVSYARYLGRMIWFGNLAVLYPRHPWNAEQVAGSCLLLVVITLLCFWKLRSRPWLTVGWLWFLGVLVPMLGVMQVGTHAMADRYTYISSIGLLIMAAWSIPAAVWRKPVLAVAAVGTTLSLLILFSIVQTQYWRNSISLFSHDIRVAGSNAEAEFILGKALSDRGELDGAINHLEKALRLDPSRADAHGDLALALALNNQADKALPLGLAAIHQEPDNPEWLVVLAYIHLQNKQYKEAAIQSRKAIDLNPHSAYAHRLLSLALCAMNDTQQGIKELKLALSIKPDLKDGRSDLERLENAARRP